MIALAHPGLFWTGLGLVSVPILIHLFFRRRHRVVRWAAMDFLLAALRKQKRRIEVENLILLLLRCAGILLLGLAIARPAVQASALNPFSGGSRALVLILDTSTSMGAEQTARTSLDRAKERASQLMSDLPEGSQVTLLVTRDDNAGGAPRALLENAAPAEIKVRLPGVHLGYGPNDLASVFHLAGEKLAALRGRRLVTFFTDLQRSDWYVADREARREGVQAALRALDREADAEVGETPVTIVDVGIEDPANVVLAALSVEKGRQAFSGKLLGVGATLVNYGTAPAKGTLSLFTDRGDDQWEKVESVEVSVDATVGLAPLGGTGQTAAFAWEFLPRVPARREGPLRFKAVFSPRADADSVDRLRVDSERYLALRVRPPVRVLPVRSRTGALEIIGDVALLDVIDFLPAVYPVELGAVDLSRVDILLWADAEIHNLAPEAATRIEEFVRAGGGLLAYLGPFTEASQLNQLFWREDGSGLLPARAGDWREDRDHPVFIDRQAETTRAHPLFEQTDGPFFFSPEVLGYRHVVDAPDRAVVARYDNGDPAVLEKQVGRGRVLLVTTTPDEIGFTLNGSVLPAILFFNAAHYLVSEDPRLTNVLVGEPVTVPLPAGTRRVSVLPPEAAGGLTEEPVEEHARQFVLHDTTAPGFYRITAQALAATGASGVPLEATVDAAANLDPAEGDLRRASPAQLRRDFQGVPLEFTEDVSSLLPKGTQGGEDDMSRALLGAVVLILFLELLFAWRFGTRRRANA